MVDIINQLQRDGMTLQKNTATVLVAQSRASSVNSVDLLNANAKGARVYVDVVSVSGSAAVLDVKLQSKDSVSGKYLDLAGASFPQITAATSIAMTVYPGIAAAANVAVSDVLVFNWRIVATIGGGVPAPAFEFGVDVDYIA